MNANTNSRNNKPEKSVYQIVTERIVMQLAKNEIPWRRAWCAPGKEDTVNYISREPYKGLNRILITRPGEYLTFKQIQSLGGHLKKGAKSEIVTFFSPYIPKDKKEEAKKLEEEGRSTDHLKQYCLKYYTVFNLDDVDGIESKFQKNEMKEAENTVAYADWAIKDYGAKYGVTLDERRCDISQYDPETDTVTVPEKRQFITEEEWYGQVFSGLVRSTAREDRCNRVRAIAAALKKEDTVKEELIAEIGSSMTLSAVGLDRKEATENTAAICKKWIAAMQNDVRLIVSASNQAEKAAKMILGNQA